MNACIYKVNKNGHTDREMVGNKVKSKKYIYITETYVLKVFSYTQK